jgi:hypothetical protein
VSFLQRVHSEVTAVKNKKTAYIPSLFDLGRSGFLNIQID